MRFMMAIKANKDSEAGVMPSEATLRAMGKYNEELAKAGVLLAGEGLAPSSKGAKVRYSKGKISVVDGPFAETKELIAGFWIIQVKSKEEAIQWAKRVPFNADAEYGPDAEIELRQVFDVEDFSNAPPELVEQEKRLRAATAKKN